MKNLPFTLLRASAIAACIASLSVAQAANITWDGVNATTTSWGTPGAGSSTQWVGGTVPSAGDDVVITGDGAGSDPTDNATFSATTINKLTLTGTIGVALNTKVKVGAGGIYNNMTSNSLTLSNGAELTVNQTWGGTRSILVQGSRVLEATKSLILSQVF